MRPFTYEQARQPADAVASVAGREGAMYLAGGTNLVDHLKLGVATPDVLVDVSRLPLDRVEPTDDGGLLIGAAVRNSDLADHALIRKTLCELGVLVQLQGGHQAIASGLESLRSAARQERAVLYSSLRSRVDALQRVA